MTLSEPFIRRPVATTLLALSVLLLGALAYFNLAVAPLPEVDFPTIQISAGLAGASAETMANAVASPLERALSQVPQVTSMTSSSSAEKTSITMQFDLSRNIDGAAQDVQAALASAQSLLPRNLSTPPRYHKVNPAEFTILSLALTSDTRPLVELNRLADNFLAQQLSQIPGVGLVDYHGQQRPAVRIQIDPDALSARGLTLDDVRSIVGINTVSAPTGSVEGAAKAVTLNTTDQLLNPQQYKDMVVAYKNGAPIRIGDLGTVIAGAEDVKQAASLQNHTAVIVDIHKQPGFNVLATTKAIVNKLPALTASFPRDVTVTVVGDRTQTIQASVLDVQYTLMISIALVVMVIFVFLRNLSSTVIPSVTIPLALLGTFAAMYLLGYSLDNLSVMGLSIAVGFVVDDAIVVLENIVRHIEMGKPRLQAAIDGAKEVGFTVVSMTVSLIAVFLPILLMSGMVGRLFREFAVIVALAVLVSGLVSLTVTPMMAAWLIRHQHGERHGRFYRWSESAFDALQSGYRSSLDWTLRHGRLMLFAMAATLLATGALYVRMPKGFFPQQDTGQISVTIQGAPDVSFVAMRDSVAQVSEAVQSDPDVQDVYAWVGANPTVSQARMMINLKPFALRRATAEEVAARLKKRAAGVSGVKVFMQVRQDIQIGGRSSNAQYQYTLQDADISELTHWSGVLETKLRSLPQLRDLSSDMQRAAAQATLEINRDTAARLGITAQQIDDALYDAFGQRQVATLFTQLDQYHVILELDPHWQVSTDSLQHLYVRSSITSQLVPLSMLGTLKDGVSPVTISHQGLFPAVTLSFNLAPGVALGDAVTAIDQAALAAGKPDSVVATFQGAAQAFQDSLRSQPWLILAAVIVVYMVLGILYESPIHPITIISTLPSAGLGALLALMVAGQDLSILGMIGIILLIGIVKKNAIMMVDFALAAERNEGLAPLEAIRQGCLRRFRPIMMTTMAALLGALPLALGHGAGAEMRRPLGIAIVGGLLVSQVLTLYTTPAVYLAFSRLSQGARAMFARRVSAAGAPSDLTGG